MLVSKSYATPEIVTVSTKIVYLGRAAQLIHRHTPPRYRRFRVRQAPRRKITGFSGQEQMTLLARLPSTSPGSTSWNGSVLPRVSFAMRICTGARRGGNVPIAIRRTISLW
jgi:hypothetical protein